jgi:hypothetical protein
MAKYIPNRVIVRESFVTKLGLHIPHDLDSITVNANQEKLRVTRFTLDNASFWMKIEPTANAKDSDFQYYRDSNWTGQYKEFAGFIIYLLRMPICWRSKSKIYFLFQH